MRYVDVLHVATYRVANDCMSTYFVSTIECDTDQGARRKAERSLRTFFKNQECELVSLTLGYVRPCGGFPGLAGKPSGYSLPVANERV